MVRRGIPCLHGSWIPGWSPHRCIRLLLSHSRYQFLPPVTDLAASGACLIPVSGAGWLGHNILRLMRRLALKEGGHVLVSPPPPGGGGGFISGDEGEGLRRMKVRND